MTLPRVAPIVLACSVLGLFVCAQAQDVETSPPQITFNEVLVTGEQPGPGLWKVTKGDHVLWILGVLSPLPKDAAWRSKQVEKVIQESQEVFAGVRVRYSPRDRDEKKLFRQMVRNPDGEKLKTVLPADVYQRFKELNKQFAGNRRSLEAFRPSVAVQELYSHALRRAGLSPVDIKTTIKALADQHSVNYREVVYDDSAHFKVIAAQLNNVSRDAEVACAKSKLGALESEVRYARARANAWAVGDVDILLRDAELRPPSQVQSCTEFWLMSPRLRQLFDVMQKRSETELEVVLNKNTSTLALLQLSDLLSQHGILETFRAQGYQVDEPSTR